MTASKWPDDDGNPLIPVEAIVERIRSRVSVDDPRPKARAYAKGIPMIYATDTEEYLAMSLTELGEEWNVDPVDILAVLAQWDEERERIQEISKEHKVCE